MECALSRGKQVGLAAAAGLIACLVLASGASANVGDVYVADEDALGGDGVIFRIAATGGDATSIASSPVLLTNPGGMAMDANGQLLVADYESDSVIRVNPSTGHLSTIAGGGELMDPYDVVLGADGKIYAIGYSTPSHLYRIDPATGGVKTIATGSGEWNSGVGIAVARNGTIYFTDNDEEVFRRDPGTGAITEVADAPQIPDGADGLTLSPDERFLFVAVDSGPPTSPLIKIDLRSGATSTLSTVTARFIDQVMLPNGGFLISNTTVPNPSIQRVGPTGGIPTDFSTDAELATPHGIVVEPSRCAGRVPTVVGTSANETIRGSRFADVISTLGGGDVVRGLGGKDVICGGKGRDRLIGGAGADRLLGGPGRDRLVGGKGRDKLRGGPGRDFQRQ